MGGVIRAVGRILAVPAALVLVPAAWLLGSALVYLFALDSYPRGARPTPSEAPTFPYRDTPSEPISR